MREHISPEELRKLLIYEQETGRFLDATGAHIFGSIHGRDGYRTIKVVGKAYPTRRLALALVNGEWPDIEVGYLDRELPFPARDRISNISTTVVDGVISPEQVRDLFDYDHQTGVLRWKTARRGVKVGARAGSVDTNGYRYVPIRKRFYLAQRLAWAHVHGVWPKKALRFVNDDTDDCRIDNLREAEFDYDTKEGRRAYEKVARRRNFQTYRDQDLRKKFGPEAPAYFRKKFAEQGGKCAICKSEESAARSGRVKHLALDHNGETHQWRGLLCQRCNTGLGSFGHDPARLRAAAVYLEQYEKVRAMTNTMPSKALIELLFDLTITDENGIPHTDQKIREAGIALRDSATALALLGIDVDEDGIPIDPENPRQRRFRRNPG